MTLSAVTNGYSIDCFSDLLDEYHFESMQITLDGVKEDNDRLRVYTGGGGALKRSLRISALPCQKGSEQTSVSIPDRQTWNGCI